MGLGPRASKRGDYALSLCENRIGLGQNFSPVSR